jgi:hypothetical protein
MQISPVKRADIPQIARLYDETVRRVNASDYIPGQIRAQAPRVYPDAFWQRRLRRYCVLVAEENGSVVGIVELAPKGEIDCFISVLISRPPGTERKTAKILDTVHPDYRIRSSDFYDKTIGYRLSFGVNCPIFENT